MATRAACAASSPPVRRCSGGSAVTTTALKDEEPESSEAETRRSLPTGEGARLEPSSLGEHSSMPSPLFPEASPPGPDRRGASQPSSAAPGAIPATAARLCEELSSERHHSHWSCVPGLSPTRRWDREAWVMSKVPWTPGATAETMAGSWGCRTARAHPPHARDQVSSVLTAWPSSWACPGTQRPDRN